MAVVVPKTDMARQPRVEYPGAVQHVFARANRKELLFLDDDDRRRYLSLLERAIKKCGWLCLAYCLMPTHTHFLIETPEPNMGDGMRWFHGHYGRYFADKIERPGHVFQGRYGSKPIKHDEYLWTVVQYIARNPVKAELCERPGDWAWSSHAGVVDGTAPKWVARDRLLWYFEGLGGVPLERYAAMVG